MVEIGIIILIFLIIITAVRTSLKNQEDQLKRKKNEAELAKQSEIERQKLYDFFKSKLFNIRMSNLSFKQNKGYFTNSQHKTWQANSSNLYNQIINKPFESINLSNEEIKTIKAYIEHYNYLLTSRNDFNQKFIEKELKLYSEFFDNIEGRKLDVQQRIAIITDEDNNLVIAGAGSGKTTTIVGKVNYVIERYKVKPEEILLISFTDKSASTLAKRINIESIKVSTFHKFGKDIIVNVEGKKPSIFEQKQLKPLLTKYFNELIENNNYLSLVTEYFTNFLKPTKSQFEFENQGDYIQYIKDQNFQSYKLKNVSVKGKQTYKMEVVKSIEECKIANFLLFNNLDYEYEFPYEHDTATNEHSRYKPDFTVIQNGKKIYIEHFGISRNGNVPKWFSGDNTRTASEKYRDDMKWKREIHRQYGTTLIESYSYEMAEGILFENLTNNLKSQGIILKPKSDQEIWQIISNAAKEEINSFITLFETFITLIKSNNYSINEIINKNKLTQDQFYRERNSLFIEIIKPIFQRYENRLVERTEIDFSDMINKATKYITDLKYNQKFRYIIIDEFQDISIGRYKLVKAIKTNNPSCKLFCVGDDWQSIYRFSGSDIALFKEFENYFGVTERLKIETTYRFHNPVINLSSQFIQKNPNQTKKELKGISREKNTNYKICYSITDNKDDTLEVQKIFNELLEYDEQIEHKEIIILGRYKNDINRIKNKNYVFNIDKTNDIITYDINTNDGKSKRLVAQFMTVHKSKGLESEIVIVLNCNSGKFGFPSEISDDKVLNLLLSEADRYENGEERRLFYVAMTRAKEKVYFVTDSSYKSKFIAELEKESGITINKKCPNCKSGDIILRKSSTLLNGNIRKFFGCTNYLYGCDYTKTEWINY